MRPIIGLVAGILVLGAAQARAVTFQIQSQIVGDAYQLVTADGDVLNRRRPHVYLGLGAWDLLGDGGHGLNVHTMLRFDSDGGLSDEEAKRLYSVDRHQLSVMAAWVEGQRLAGLVDFKAGRFLHSDPIDFLLLDGASVLVRTPWYFGVEVLAGLEAKHDTNTVTASQYQLDGTRFIDGRLETRDDAATIAVGVALTTVDLRWTRARVGYRRLFSDGQIDQEKLGLGLYQRLIERLHLSVNGSYDLYNADLDQLRVLLRANATDWLDVDAQFVRLLPVFDADSIFNIFASHALNDGNLRLRLHLSKHQRVYAGGMVRFFGNEDYQGALTAPVEDVVSAYGAMAGWSYGGGHRGRAGIDVSWEAGYGGTRVLADLYGMFAPLPRQLELDARVTVVHFDEDLLENLHAVSFGYQVGARYLVGEVLGVMLLAEHNINRLQTHQFRLTAVVDLNVFL